MIAQFSVTGMTCEKCVASVTREISLVDGVTGVEIDVASGRVRVTSTLPLADSAIAGAVYEAGYDLAPR